MHAFIRSASYPLFTQLKLEAIKTTLDCQKNLNNHVIVQYHLSAHTICTPSSASALGEVVD